MPQLCYGVNICELESNVYVNSLGVSLAAATVSVTLHDIKARE